MVNKKWVKILKAARNRIESGEEEFVCLAILECKLGIFDVFYDKAKYELRKEISERLGTHSTVCTWLKYKDRQLWEGLISEDRLKEYRLAWIDNMIEEFSGTGKFAPVITWED